MDTRWWLMATLKLSFRKRVLPRRQQQNCWHDTRCCKSKFTMRQRSPEQESSRAKRSRPSSFATEVSHLNQTGWVIVAASAAFAANLARLHSSGHAGLFSRAVEAGHSLQAATKCRWDFRRTRRLHRPEVAAHCAAHDCSVPSPVPNCRTPQLWAA
jgi:hypothetical protein